LADPNTRQGKRTPVTLKIKFKSETLEQFIERYAVDVSQGGIFIRTKEPLAVGTQMKFEFQLRDASPLIAGEGTVVWTRENDPSRPAIAPGMGVRFDRLADGSQTVLEKILSEKAKQAPSRSNNETAPGQNKQMFTDVPTKVAPAPVQEALGLRSRSESEQTPLPKPMPFHSDADDFDENAFQEATKVRSIEDLALDRAELDGNRANEDDGSGLDDNPKNATVMMPADELAVRRRVSAEHLATDPLAEEPPPEASAAKSVPDRESAPALPSAPAVDASNRAPRMLDTTPSPRAEPAAAAESSEPAKPAKPTTSAPDSAAPRAVAAEPSRPVAPQRPSSAPIVIALLVAVAAAAAAVWFFVLRDDGSSKVATTTPDNGSAVVDKGSAVVPDNGSAAANTGSNPDTSPDQGSAGSATAMTGSNAGSAAAMAGSNAGSATPPAAMVDTVIAAARGATIEITGTDQKGPAPFTAKLEKDKAYKAHVTAPGYLPADVDVKGGQKTTAKLTFKPHVLTVTTDPAGADIYVDNVNTQKMTPSDVTLSQAQSAKPRVRVSLRRPGFRPIDQMVEASAFEDQGSKVTASITIKLQVQQQVVRPPTGSGSAAAGSGTGAGSSTGGGATGSGDTGAGSASTTPPPPTPTPTPAPAPAPTPAPAAGSAAPSGGQTLK
jgi:uncharacterized protein (TIGR02266 family)